MERKLIELSETVEFTPEGELQRIAVYKFMIDGYGPRELRIPVEEESVEKIEAWLKSMEEIIGRYKEGRP